MSTSAWAKESWRANLASLSKVLPTINSWLLSPTAPSTAEEILAAHVRSGTAGNLLIFSYLIGVAIIDSERAEEPFHLIKNYVLFLKVL